MQWKLLASWHMQKQSDAHVLVPTLDNRGALLQAYLCVDSIWHTNESASSHSPEYRPWTNPNYRYSHLPKWQMQVRTVEH